MNKIKFLMSGLFVGGALLAASATTTVNADNLGAGPGTSTANLSGNTTISASQPFFAADGAAAKANTTAQFNVQGGYLSLVAVPDLNFGTVNANTVVNGGTQALKDNKVDTGSSKGSTAFDGNASGQLIVSDMRGTAAGWKLNAAMSPTFKSADGSSSLNGITLGLSATGTNSFNGQNPLTLSGTSVSTTDENKGIGDTTFSLTGPTNASLTFPAGTNSTFTAGTAYQSDITWTLVSAD